MSDFDAALSVFGGQEATQKPSKFDPSGSYGTPSNVLDGLMKTESSGNAYAINKDTKAMGPYQFTPDTVAMLHKQGIKFDPFDPKESRAAADWYVSQLAQRHGGDIKAALADYGGFKTKDPSGYQAKVMGTPAPVEQPKQASDFDAALGVFDQSEQPSQRAPAPAAVTSQPAPVKAGPRPTGDTGTLNDYSGQNDVNSSGTRLAAHLVTGLGSSLYGGVKSVPVAVSGLMGGLFNGKSLSDSIDQGVNEGADAVTQAQRDYTYRPKEGTSSAELVDKFDTSGYNPLNWPSMAGSSVGEFLADHGQPAAGAAANAGISVFGLPVALKGVTKLSSLARPGEVSVIPRTDPVFPAAEKLPATQEGQPTPSVPLPLTDSPSPSFSAQPMTEPALTKGAQAQAKPAAQIKPSGAPAEEVAPTAQVASPAEQSRRAQVLNSVGIENVRKSALTGDGSAAATDYQTSKLDTPSGKYMKSVLDNEKASLANYGEKLIQETGGTAGVDQSHLYTRGETISHALDSYKGWFDDRIGQLYKAADERAQGTPANLNKFNEVLNDASELTNSDRVHLQSAVQSYLKKLQMTGEDGGVAGSAMQAETVRKYLNEQWSPQNSKWVGKLKDALDDDVTSSAGSDIYNEARQMRTQRGATLDNPNGIAKIMDSSGPNGINRAVATEKIPDNLMGMPADQFAHVVETIKNMPPELQPQAQAAMAEIKAQFANRLQAVGTSQAGQWNAKGVKQFLSNNKARMSAVFSPEEMKSFQNLHEAGQILAKDQSYPGAAVQGMNLLRSGVAAGIQGGAAAIGGSVLGPPGAFVGSYVGGKAAQAFSDRSSLGAAQKRVQKLSDLLPPDKR